ncbi:MAG: hypothetical protein QOE33_3586 [Acidobacteriota bacterium]|nr:hypothetical protein [Acidobacteriota bacterium]
MAEERTLATARAPEAASPGGEPSKEELQRRMDEARDSISQTVNDIKDTVTTKYEDVRESISQTLDWREQFRRRPIAFAAGAGVAGLILGYSVGGAVFGDEDDLATRYYGAEGDYDEGSEHARSTSERSYASQAITGGAYGSTAYAPAPPPSAEAAARPSYSSGYEAQPVAQQDDAESESDKPSLFSRFQETQAYDRLQQEVGNLGNRFVEELSKTAQNVVLPALLGKLKDLIGIDLSAQREVAQRSRLEQQATVASNAAGAGTETGAGASMGGSGTSYGTGSGGYGKSL